MHRWSFASNCGLMPRSAFVTTLPMGRPFVAASLPVQHYNNYGLGSSSRSIVTRTARYPAPLGKEEADANVNRKSLFVVRNQAQKMWEKKMARRRAQTKRKLNKRQGLLQRYRHSDRVRAQRLLGRFAQNMLDAAEKRLDPRKFVPNDLATVMHYLKPSDKITDMPNTLVLRGGEAIVKIINEEIAKLLARNALQAADSGSDHAMAPIYLDIEDSARVAVNLGEVWRMTIELIEQKKPLNAAQREENYENTRAIAEYLIEESKSKPPKPFDKSQPVGYVPKAMAQKYRIERVRIPKFYEAVYNKIKLPQMKREAEANIKWTIQTALLYERYPQVLPDPTELELEFKAFQLKRWNETANNPQRNLELREENIALVKGKSAKKDKKKAKKKGEGEGEGEAGKAAGKTGEEGSQFAHSPWRESYEDALARLEKMSPRVTEADHKNDTHSLDRKLKEKLFLLVKTGGVWQFPQTPIQENETLRVCSERTATAVLGSRVKALFFTNTPLGCYKQEYSPQDQKQHKATGSKLFFFRAQHLGGNLALSKTYEDFAWVAKDELGQYLPNDLTDLAQKMIWDHNVGI